MSRVRSFLEEGSLVVMTPEPPPGAEITDHAPVLVTILQLDGDVTTKVAGPKVTKSLLIQHFERVSALRDELIEDMEKSAKTLGNAVLAGRWGTTGLSALGGGTAGTQLDLQPEALVPLVGAAAAAAIAPHLDVGKKAIRNFVRRRLGLAPSEGGGWKTGSLTAV